MAVKFSLKIEDGTPDGVQIKTLRDLRDNFNLKSVLDHYVSGVLLKWLEVCDYDDHADKIRELDSSSPDFNRNLCDVLGVEYSEESAVDVSVSASVERNERLEKLRTFTADDKILAAVDSVAFTQEELPTLAVLGATVYLCGDAFVVPAVEGVTYVGVGGSPKVELPQGFASLGIVLENVQMNADDIVAQAKTTPEIIEKLLTIGDKETVTFKNKIVKICAPIEIEGGELIFDNCEIMVTYYDEGSPAITCDDGGGLRILNSEFNTGQFADNENNFSFSVIEFEYVDTDKVIFYNCNFGGYGGEICEFEGTIKNCTFGSNWQISCSPYYGKIENCIFKGIGDYICINARDAEIFDCTFESDCDCERRGYIPVIQVIVKTISHWAHIKNCSFKGFKETNLIIDVEVPGGIISTVFSNKLKTKDKEEIGSGRELYYPTKVENCEFSSGSWSSLRRRLDPDLGSNYSATVLIDKNCKFKER